MAVFTSKSFDDHEQVVFFRDAKAKLTAIIAVHSTLLGPATGGCRMWPYASEEEALEDVLRLSRGMSYKNAMAGLPLGGGKAVIIADSKRDKTPELMRAFGRAVASLGGRYISAEDVGVSVADMEEVAKETRFVVGLQSGPHASGDPSPHTAQGIYRGIQAAVRYRLGRDGLAGLKIAVQGLGHVGEALCHRLAADGAALIVADIHPERVQAVAAATGAAVADPEAILSVAADVLAPCALGGVLNDQTIPALQVSVVAGSANNQLAEERHGQMLADRGILYAPDYVINAGGIINVIGEILGNYDPIDSLRRVEAIYGTLMEIFDRAAELGVGTNVVADKIARERIARAEEKRLVA